MVVLVNYECDIQRISYCSR